MSELKFGMRGHDVAGAGSVEQALHQISDAGIRHLQLVMKKQFTEKEYVSSTYDEGAAFRLLMQLKENKVHVDVLGCYINPVAPSNQLVNEAFSQFRNHILYAKVIESDVIATETGRFSDDMSVTSLTDTNDCYLRLLRGMEPIVDFALSNNVVPAFEGVFDHTIATPEKMFRFLSDLQTDRVKVILDIANLMSPDMANDAFSQMKRLDYALSHYKERIVKMHLKDCVFDERGVQKVVRPGCGVICYDRLLPMVREAGICTVSILEESSASRFAEDGRYFQNCYAG